MRAVSAAMSTGGWASAGIVGSLARHRVAMEASESTSVAPRDAPSLLRGFSALCSGRLALRLRHSLSQILEDRINRLQLARFAHGDQQFCILVKTNRRRIRFAEHFPAGLNRGSDVFDFVGFEVRGELVEATRFLLSVCVGLEMVEKPDRILTQIPHCLETILHAHTSPGGLDGLPAAHK